jgi:transposase InsO family protein
VIEIEVGDIIGFCNSNWQIRDYDGFQLRLVCLSDGVEKALPVGVLMADESFRPPRATGKSIADQRLLDMLPDQRREDAEFWSRHMRQVKDADELPRAGSHTTVEQRLASKRDELARLGVQVSMSTMWRRYQGFIRSGTMGCADLRGMPGHVRTSQLDERVSLIFNEVRATYTDKSTPSQKQVIEMAKHRLMESGIPVPSRSCAYELLRRLDRGEHTHGEARSRRSYATSPDRAFGKVYALFPGEEVQLDTTPLDAMVLMADGQTTRVDLAVAIDVATRTILAAILRPNACKSVDAIELISRAMLPLEMLPGWMDQMAVAKSYIGEEFFTKDQVSDCLAERPLIDVRGVVTDRGSIFVSETFLNAMEARGIQVGLAPPGAPTAKPIVERVFKTIGDDFVAYVPGYKGRSVAHRGKHPERDAVWPLNVLQSVLDEWVLTVYQRKPHDGLRLPGAPRIQHSPNEIYRALSEVAPGKVCALTVDEWISLLPCEWRRINRYGVNFHKLLYDNRSDRFQGLRRSKSANTRQNGRWEVRYDPANLLQIWLRDLTYGHDADGNTRLIDQGWIECRWVLADYASRPFGIDVLHAVVRGLGKRKITDQEVLARSEEIHRQLLAGPDVPDGRKPTMREEGAVRSNITRQETGSLLSDELNSTLADVDREQAPIKSRIAKLPSPIEPMRPLRLSDGW